jgi:hypothetical protein
LSAKMSLVERRLANPAAADAEALGGKVDSGDWRCIGPGWLI